MAIPTAIPEIASRSGGERNVADVGCRHGQGVLRPGHTPIVVVPPECATRTPPVKLVRPSPPYTTTYASMAKYAASPSRSSDAAVSLLRASTRCQNSRSSWPGKGAESFCD